MIMVKSVIRVHHWDPRIIESLYLDDADFLGLEFWYNDVVGEDKKIKDYIGEQKTDKESE